jgi:hypothetical protein
MGRIRSEELKRRTKEFGLRVIKLVEALPNTKTGDVFGRQLLRSATAVGANYRAACRARSQADLFPISLKKALMNQLSGLSFCLKLTSLTAFNFPNCSKKPTS